MNEKQKLLIAALSASAILSAPIVVKAAEDPANVDKQNQYEAFDVEEPENSQKEKAANDEKSLSVGDELSDTTNTELAVPPQNLEKPIDIATSSAPETTQNEVTDEKDNQQTQEVENSEPETSKKEVKQEEEQATKDVTGDETTTPETEAKDEAKTPEAEAEAESTTPEIEAEAESTTPEAEAEAESTTPEAEAEAESTTPEIEAEAEAQVSEAEVTEKTEESQVVEEKLAESAQPEGSAGQSNPQNQEADPTPNTNDGNVTTENQIDDTNEFLETNKKTPAAPLKAGQEQSAEPNYAKDEKKINDYSEDERYRSSQMEPGGGPSYSSNARKMESKDGYSYKTLEPSATSEDKTQWGIEIEIDKEKGQRTYTDFSFSNTGNYDRPYILEDGNVSANEVGKKLSEKGGFQDTNYKPDAEIEIKIVGRGPLKTLNLNATAEDLKHINKKGNKKIIMAWEGKYTKDHPYDPRATQGTSAAFSFTVNPWPNENDKLQIIKLNGKHDDKEFVQGQTITTNVKVDNLDKSAKERLVGQVYHPLTGEVVPGAKAYINDEGKVVVEMPEGAVNKDGTINKGSIFYKDPKFKGIQNLEVKFFARPRTADEFKVISDKVNKGYGYYTSTGAGTKTINHKGTEVTVDLQGIDRYDHYNLIGGFKLNLDDTRYYDQGFINEEEEKADNHTFNDVRAGIEYKIKGIDKATQEDEDTSLPKITGDNPKTAEEMQDAVGRGEASLLIDQDFIDKQNKKLNPKDKWIIEPLTSGDVSNFKITAPKSSEPGDHISIPVTYTYTNGSIDTHWFHFVVQGSLIRPEYEAQVDLPSKQQTSPVEVKGGGEKDAKPNKYSIKEGTEFKDNKGNAWSVSIDETTGQVTAKPKDPSNFKGGEKIQVPVIAHYSYPEKPEKVVTQETLAEFVIKQKSNIAPDYNAKAGKAGDKLSSEAILNKEDTYNRKPGKYTLESNAYTDNKGNTWNVSIEEETGKVTATVPEGVSNDKLDGALLNVPVIAHYYEEDGTNEVGTKKTEVQFVATGTQGTHTITEEIPFEIEVKKDPKIKSGLWEYAKDEAGNELKGEKGEQEKTLTIVDSKVTKISDSKVTKKPKNAVILIGEEDYTGTVTHTEKIETPFEVEYQYSDQLEAGQSQIKQKGEKGSYDLVYSQKIKNGEADGEATKEKKNVTEAKKKIIVIGIKPVEKTESIPHDTTYKHNPELAAGTIVKKSDGTPGTVTITTSFNKETGKLETQVTRTEPTNAVYEYGSKTEGKVTVTSDIPYEVEFVPDDTMVSGETEVEQEGELGKKETTIIIENSVESSRTEKVTKKPVKKIVKYGTLCKVPGTDDPSKPGTEDPGKPGTEDPSNPDTEDPGKPGTEDPGKPGTEDPSNPDTEDPGKPGTEDPVKPGTEDPGKPGTEDPSHPGTEDSSQPGSEDPSHPGTEKPDKEGLLKPSDDKPSQPGNNDTEVSADKAFENIEGESAGTTNMSNEDYRKAPQTSDPGVGGYLKLGGLATALFAFLQRKKKEADEE